MTPGNDLYRFIEAQKGSYEIALTEIRRGKKTSHWMWYIFPQIHGLGSSETTRFFAIKDKAEATLYLKHPLLGARLIEICKELLSLNTSDPVKIFGSVDGMKLKSSMTLFSLLEPPNAIFQKVLSKFFDGEKDKSTIKILGY